jgi:chromosome segregation ATPase
MASPDLETMSKPALSVGEDRHMESLILPQLPKPIRAREIPGRTASRERSEIPVRKHLAPALLCSSDPDKLRLQSTQTRREHLQNEKQEITKAGHELQQEIDKIGEELRLKPKRSSRAKAVTRSLEQVDPRLPEIHELNSKYDALKRSFEAALAKKGRQLEAGGKDLKDCLNENDITFEKLNEELVKISNSLKSGSPSVEMLKILQEAKLEQEKLKRENM